MRKGFLIAAILSAAAFPQAFACDADGKSGFLPDNNFRIPVGDKMAGDMTKERFLAVIDTVNAVYKPIVENFAGKPFIINRRWDDDIVNASAMQWKDSWRVTLYGGLARHPLITDDAFMTVICHEIGHHMGGFPIALEGKHWATNEGQSDYFATLKCMRRVLAGEDNIAVVSKMQVDEEAARQCGAVYKSQAEAALCKRIAMAAKATVLMMASYTENTKASFTTPDASRVSRTKDEHPDPQCRLDTFFQGALCDKPVNEDVSRINPTPGTCTVKGGFTKGVRPACWYKPSTEDLPQSGAAQIAGAGVRGQAGRALSMLRAQWELQERSSLRLPEP